MVTQPFAEFGGDRRLLWIAEEWQRYSPQLAEWAMEHLVNRRDVWSQYTLKNGEVGVVQLPIKERRGTGADMVTLKKLQRHFSGRAVSHLIGLHAISDHQTAKWFAIDVDLHDENIVNADEIALANFTACHEWALRLRSQGFDPLLIDSNGAGGYHVMVILDREYPLADVYDFVDELRSDYNAFGLPRKPEVFPPKREVEKDSLPYALRVFGRHHTRLHYSRVWNFESFGDNDWLEGGEAIEAILSTRPSPLPNGKKKKAARSPAVPAKKKTEPSTGRKPRVCVDLDGVLAKYESWQGSDVIGPPLPGAVEFAKSLARFADIVVFTSRCSPDQGGVSETKRVSPAKLRLRIVEWLEEFKIPYADVYIGQGKPRAAAFIDDRAVACRPQDDPTAFKNALTQARSLIRSGKSRPYSTEP
ncbi:MAG: hypothetical protein AB7F88_01850 [Pyrinomonadaceae bacterium]